MKSIRNASRGAARGTLLWVLAALAALSAYACTFTVRPGDHVVVARFGDLRRDVTDPGLHLRMPAPIDTLYRVDMRQHLLDLEVEELLTAESRSLEVDAFVAWRVQDPKVFLASLRSRDGADARLGDALRATLMDVFRRTRQADVIRVGGSERDLAVVTDEVQRDLQVLCDANGYGVEITLAGIERLTFTADNMPAIERKMREERNGVATSISLEARKQASRIANDSKQAVAEIQSAAEAEAIEIRGGAQARVKEIEAESLALDPDLFEFQRTLEVAEKVLRDGTLVIGTDHPLLEIFDVLLRSTSGAGGEPDNQ